MTWQEVKPGLAWRPVLYESSTGRPSWPRGAQESAGRQEPIRIDPICGGVEGDPEFHGRAVATLPTVAACPEVQVLDAAPRQRLRDLI